jgi:hypothetical protein
VRRWHGQIKRRAGRVLRLARLGASVASAGDSLNIHARHIAAPWLQHEQIGRAKFRAASMIGAGISVHSSGEAARLPRWLVAIGLGVPLALILLAASPLGTNFFYVVVGIPALLFAWIVAGVAALLICVRSAIRKDWRRCAIAAVLPIVLLVVALDPIGFVKSCNYVGDVIHFAILKPTYDREIAALPPDRRPRLAVFSWGGMLWASSGVVYDETDQVSLPRGSQSADWLAAASHSELSCGYGVQPLWDHYYLASFAC